MPDSAHASPVLVRVNPLVKVKVRGSREMAFYGFATRLAPPPDRVIELVDIVLTATPDTHRDGMWEVSVGGDRLLEAVTTGVPTAHDVERILIGRGEHRFDPEVESEETLGLLPRRWVRRPVAEHHPDTTILTSVHAGRLMETHIDAHACAATLGPMVGLRDGRGRLAAWEATLHVCRRPRRDGSAPTADPRDPWAGGPLRGVERGDDGPWLPSRHVLRLQDDTVTCDGEVISILDPRPGLPNRSVVRRRLVGAALRLLNIPYGGPMHALDLYARLPRVEELFPGSLDPVDRPGRRGLDRSAHQPGVEPVLVLQHENGVVHVRGTQSVSGRVMRLLTAVGIAHSVHLNEGAAWGTVDDITSCDQGEGDDLVRRISTVLNRDPSLAALGYAPAYDARTPGPLVRYVRVDHGPLLEGALRRWIHIVDYREAGGTWVFGVVDTLCAVRAVAQGLDMPLLEQPGASGDLGALCLTRVGDGARLADEVRRAGLVVLTDEFGPGTG